MFLDDKNLQLDSVKIIISMCLFVCLLLNSRWNMWSNVICLLSRRSYTDTCKPRESFLQMVLRKTRRYKTKTRTHRKQCIKITSWTYDFCFIKLVCRLFLQVSFMANEISIRDCFKWLQLFFTIHKGGKKKKGNSKCTYISQIDNI